MKKKWRMCFVEFMYFVDSALEDKEEYRKMRKRQQRKCCFDILMEVLYQEQIWDLYDDDIDRIFNTKYGERM